jgi:hypothetical protein
MPPPFRFPPPALRPLDLDADDFPPPAALTRAQRARAAAAIRARPAAERPPRRLRPPPVLGAAVEVAALDVLDVLDVLEPPKRLLSLLCS